MARPKSPHGTYAAVRRHQAAKEAICPACKEWQAAERKRNALKAAGLGDEAKKVVDPKPVTIVFGGASAAITRDEIREALGDAKERLNKPLDLKAELYKSLALIDLALESTVHEDPAKAAPLSKRRSEILAELVAAGVEVKDAIEDPMAEFVDHDNVTPIAR